MDIPRDYDPTPWRESTPGISHKAQVKQLKGDEHYSRMADALREIDALLPEGARPWEVAQISLEFADHINFSREQSFHWRGKEEHEKAGTFVDFLKNVYGKYQSIPLDNDDH